MIALMWVCVGVNAQILYKVESKNGTKPSYVFGSHHLSPISVVEESGVMDYFNQTDQVVGEIDLTMDPMALSMALQPYMMAPADSTLSVLLKGENLERVILLQRDLLSAVEEAILFPIEMIGQS